MRMRTIAALKKLDACPEAAAWVYDLTFEDPREVLMACRQGGWTLWLATKLADGLDDYVAIVRAVADIASLATPFRSPDDTVSVVAVASAYTWAANPCEETRQAAIVSANAAIVPAERLFEGLRRGGGNAAIRARAAAAYAAACATAVIPNGVSRTSSSAFGIDVTRAATLAAVAVANAAYGAAYTTSDSFDAHDVRAKMLARCADIVRARIDFDRLLAAFECVAAKIPLLAIAPYP